MFYIDLKQTNDVLLTFEALKVKFLKILGHWAFYWHGHTYAFWYIASLVFIVQGVSIAVCVKTVTNENFLFRRDEGYQEPHHIQGSD